MLLLANGLDSVDIDKDAPLPLYHQVRTALLTLIEDGGLLLAAG